MSRFLESYLCFDFVLHSLTYVGSRDLVRQWPAVHDQNRFLDETFKTRCSVSPPLLRFSVRPYLGLNFALNGCMYSFLYKRVSTYTRMYLFVQIRVCSYIYAAYTCMYSFAHICVNVYTTKKCSARSVESATRKLWQTDRPTNKSACQCTP